MIEYVVYLISRHFLLTVAFNLMKISEIQSLTCRSYDHKRQQQDFYDLVNTCIEMNATSTNQTQPVDTEPRHLQTHPMQQYPQQRQQKSQLEQRRQQQQHHSRPENIATGNRNSNYVADQYRDNRYGANKSPNEQQNINFNDGGVSFESVPNTCICTDQEGYIQRYGFDERRISENKMPFLRNQMKRASMNGFPTRPGKNLTQTEPIKVEAAPLEEIGSCVIHCIFKEMKMLNNENKPDRRSMIIVMTDRLQDSELKEFIQDSIEECFEIMDSDNHEEHCDFSKKLIICLEEKAKRECEDWEYREHPAHAFIFNSSKNFVRQLDRRNQGIGVANMEDENTDYSLNKNSFNRWNSNSGS